MPNFLHFLPPLPQKPPLSEVKGKLMIKNAFICLSEPGTSSLRVVKLFVFYCYFWLVCFQAKID